MSTLILRLHPPDTLQIQTLQLKEKMSFIKTPSARLTHTTTTKIMCCDYLILKTLAFTYKKSLGLLCFITFLETHKQK